jgi:hypothetical protein
MWHFDISTTTFNFMPAAGPDDHSAHSTTLGFKLRTVHDDLRTTKQQTYTQSLFLTCADENEMAGCGSFPY